MTLFPRRAAPLLVRASSTRFYSAESFSKKDQEIFAKLEAETKKRKELFNTYKPKVRPFGPATKWAEQMFINSGAERKRDVLSKDLLALKELGEKNKDFDNFMKSSGRLSRDEINKKLDEVFKQIKGDKVSRGNIDYLVSNRKGHLYKEVAASFKKMLNVENNELDVKVTVPAPMSEDEKQEMIKMINQQFKASKINVSWLYDPTIIGGSIIKTDTVMADLSYRTKINEWISKWERQCASLKTN